MAKLCLQWKFNQIAVLILIMICSLTTNAQLNPAIGTGQWKYVNPFQYGFVLNDMSFVDNNTGLGVGNNGAIARTTDGGFSWQYIAFKYVSNTNQVTQATFNDVHFVTPTVAYAVGSGGLMIKSTDGGLNWAQITTPLTPFNRAINALHFINKDTGYIGGAAINTTNTISVNDAPKVYFTRNGGATWDSLVSPYRKRQYNTALPTPNPVQSGFNTTDIQRIVFVNDSVGYACGSANANRDLSAILWKIEKGVITDYSLHRTKFGVSSYTVNHTASTQTFKGLVVINDSLVLISSNSNGSIVRVKTGKNDSTANAVPAIYGAYEKGAYEVVAQANTFPPYPTNSPLFPGPMWHMKKAPGGKIVLSNGSQLAISSDNGTSWTASRPPVPHTWWSLFALDVTPNGRIVTGGSSGIMYDSLPGSPWRTQYKNVKPLNEFGIPNDFSSMAWADYCNGILVGSNGTFVKTSDGGKTWENNTNPVFEAAQIGFSKVIYPAVNSMFFSTFNSIYKSADQGTTNDVIFTEPNPNGQINAFDMVGKDSIWAVGHRFSGNERTGIFRTRNASAVSPVWDTVKTFPIGSAFAPQLRNIKFANKDTGYVCGSRSKVYRTVDGGNTWTDISFDTLAPNNNINYTALSVIDGKTLYVGGSSKKLYKSIDAGVTWTDLTLQATTPSTVGNFTSISIIEMNDVNNGYLMAQNFLLKTTDGWATWTYDIPPLGISSLTLYPKINAPIQNKKLYATTLQASSFVNSQISATLLEYGNTSLTTLATTETVVNATCTNLTAGTITVTATGGILPYTFSVNGGAYQTSNILTGLTQGAKTVSIKDGSCQTVTKTVTVGFTDNLTLTTNNDTTVCAGAPVQMIATSAATTYAWTPAAGLSNAAIRNPIATVNSNTAYTVTASLNTCVKTRTVNIAIKPNPVVNAGPDKIIVAGDIIQLQGSGANAGNIAWTPTTSIVSNGNTYTPTVNPFITTTYRLSVKDNSNCTSTDDVIITVMPYCIKIMDAFTPNNDGMNDKWLVTNGAACTQKISVNVFNRYGANVYKNDNYQNTWDGTFNGKAIPDGTYYYVIVFRLINGNGITSKGNVTILR